MMAGKARFRMVLTMVWGHVPTTAKHEVTYERRPPHNGARDRSVSLCNVEERRRRSVWVSRAATRPL